ncbi:hypothetical protein CLOM_g569 [Closterium sp. NIES-68]|nr:hypothetical protein CLOM_g569 [Closterium sp. NIES-68]
MVVMSEYSSWVLCSARGLRQKPFRLACCPDRLTETQKTSPLSRHSSCCSLNRDSGWPGAAEVSRAADALRPKLFLESSSEDVF